MIQERTKKTNIFNNFLGGPRIICYLSIDLQEKSNSFIRSLVHLCRASTILTLIVTRVHEDAILQNYDNSCHDVNDRNFAVQPFHLRTLVLLMTTTKIS